MLLVALLACVLFVLFLRYGLLIAYVAGVAVLRALARHGHGRLKKGAIWLLVNGEYEDEEPVS